jgi:quercetin dioxygenase-like cupin family protein
MSGIRHGSVDELPVERAFAGVERRRVDGRNMTVLRYWFEAGAAHGLHVHPEEQLMLIEAGSARLHTDDGVIEVGAGDWTVVAPEVRHGLEAGPDGVQLLVVLSPRRTAGYETTPLPGSTGDTP